MLIARPRYGDRLTLRLFRALCCVIAAVAMLASQASAEDRKTRYELHIDAASLDEALDALARATGAQLIYPHDLALLTGLNPVNGLYTVEEALNIMLERTELSGGLTESGVIVVSRSRLRTANNREDDVQKEKLRKSLLAGVASFLFGAGASAQDVETIDAGSTNSKPQEQEPDVIIVTGTNIRGAQNPASPVFVFDKEDIRISGAATAQDFIRTLPQNLDLSEFSAGGLAGPDNGLAGGGAGVNIRGLGATATLTLVNGRRLAAGAGGGDFVDISLIPLSAIERVEVLTDGASAIYGADAVAGVVNFILRDDYDGAETQVRAGTATRGRGSPKEFQASQTVGAAWSTGNIMASYEYYRRNNLDSDERSFAENAEDPADLLPNQQRHSVLLNARQEISERLELFGAGSFSSRDSIIKQNGPTFGGISSFNEGDNKQYGANINAQYAFAKDWRVNISGGYSRNEASALILLGGAFDREVGTSFDIWTGDLVADGALFEAPGGAVRVAFGGHYRSERFKRLIDRTFRTDTIDVDRDVYAAFAELVFPVIGDSNRRPGLYALDVTAAGRFEEFSDVGSSTNPKVGLRYAPIEGLSFRGTFSTAFQAPRFRDLGQEQVFSAVPGVFFPSPAGASTPNPAVLAIIGGNPDLGPETSRNYTIGVDYSPAFAQNAKLSLTYFDIDFEDRVGAQAANAALIFVTPEAFIDTAIFDPDIATVTAIFNEPSLFNFSGVLPEEVGVILDNRFRNLASTEVRGLDINLSYAEETSIGTFSLDFNGSYLFDFIDQASAVSDPIQTLNTVENPVDFRFRSSAGWRHRGYGANLFVNYVDGYTSEITGASVPVDSWTTIDLSLSYDTSVGAPASLLDNMRFNLNIRNLFDEDPPFVERPLAPGFGFDGANANALGRYISFNIAKAW